METLKKRSNIVEIHTSLVNVEQIRRYLLHFVFSLHNCNVVVGIRIVGLLCTNVKTKNIGVSDCEF